MKNNIILFIIVFIVWALLDWPLDIQSGLSGIAAAGLVVFLISGIFVHKPGYFGHVNKYLWYFCYLPLFLYVFIKANISLAVRLISPVINVNPGIVKVNTKLKSDIAVTFLANSITFASGLLCVDVDQKEGILYIHYIDGDPEERQKDIQALAGRFEKILNRIFE